MIFLIYLGFSHFLVFDVYPLHHLGLRLFFYYFCLSPVNRFVTYTDEPLQATIDSLFELFPESKSKKNQASTKKLLTFSDGRQDAAFFAADYQRNRTELVYRQMLWRAFDKVNKDNDNTVSITQVVNQLKQDFLETSLPHPDRHSILNYKSYFFKDGEESLENKRNCREAAGKRAKEI